MTLPKKGTTKIGIGPDTYLYKESPTQMVFMKDCEGHTQKMICLFPQNDYYFINSQENIGKIIKIDIHGSGFPLPKPFAREAIFSAISLGWEPDSNKKDFTISLKLIGEGHYHFEKI